MSLSSVKRMARFLAVFALLAVSLSAQTPYRLAWGWTPDAAFPLAYFQVSTSVDSNWTNVGLPLDATLGAGQYSTPLPTAASSGTTAYYVQGCSSAGTCWGTSSVVYTPTAPPPPPPPPPPVLECPAAGAGTWTGCYYSGQFGALLATRTDPAINFNWAAGSPMAAVPVDNFSVRWAGTFTFSAGDYEFSVTSDDGVRLYIDGTQLIGNWTTQAVTTKKATKTLAAGSHLVMVEYFEATHEAVMQASWVAVGVVTPPPPPPPVPVNCYVSWGAWLTTLTGSCDPVTLTARITQTRTATVMTPAANGGTACQPLTETQVISQACIITPPPPPPVDQYLIGPSTGCTRAVTVKPPDTTTGWTMQFQRRTSSTASWTAFGTTDSSAPYTRTLTFTALSTNLRAVWTKTGVASVTYPVAVVVCP